MNMITKLATKMLAVLSVVAMIASPAAAQGLSASDMAFAFGGKAAAPAAVQQTARAAAPKAAEPITIASARGMTQTEMQETEGALAPFVVVGVIHGARIVGTRMSQQAAVRVARNHTQGVFIQANSRQQAQQIARAASNGNNAGIRRELHNVTTRNPVQFRHFHPSNSNAHITWGRPNTLR